MVGCGIVTAGLWEPRAPLIANRSEDGLVTESILPRRRAALSPRTRFEVFKRDSFTCRYCARTTPHVVLQVDHVVPVADGGTDDPMNLVTSCWECNSGKRDVPLEEVITGEDPHDRAIILMERERQLREYNSVVREIHDRCWLEAEQLEHYWTQVLGHGSLRNPHFAWLVNVLETVPMVFVERAMDVAHLNCKTLDLRYVMALIRNWREDGKWPASEQ